jgi:hypothetical protein
MNRTDLTAKNAKNAQKTAKPWPSITRMDTDLRQRRKEAKARRAKGKKRRGKKTFRTRKWW